MGQIRVSIWASSVYQNHGNDFLFEYRRFDVVLTNPPFSAAQEFILRAKQVARQKVVLLLPLSYLHGKKRLDKIWTDKEFPLSSVYAFSRYVDLSSPLRDDGKYNTAMMVFAWFVWDRNHKGEPVIRWIDNNEFVLRKGECSTEDRQKGNG